MWNTAAAVNWKCLCLSRKQGHTRVPPVFPNPLAGLPGCPSRSSFSQEHAFKCSGSLAEGCDVPFRLAENTQCCSRLTCRFPIFQAPADLLSHVVPPAPGRASQLQSSVLPVLHRLGQRTQQKLQTLGIIVLMLWKIILGFVCYHSIFFITKKNPTKTQPTTKKTVAK